ncbi:Dual specificity tyrosine-phosphorylation-regulated kinase 2 [Clonorchis sinensis]|uniref:dual-specificity kinase n=1 Tax=Clonorchis sinensis TaxID=79923 RepID=A0A8T1MQZ2_CLOSI|nr:Dual specificity tyrosine-phosphorylation-regulated kinase 2 [Clonorchis sinensis]
MALYSAGSQDLVHKYAFDHGLQHAPYGRTRTFHSQYEGRQPGNRSRVVSNYPNHRTANFGAPFQLYDGVSSNQIYESSPNYKGSKSGSSMNLALSSHGQLNDRHRTRKLGQAASQFASIKSSSDRNKSLESFNSLCGVYPMSSRREISSNFGHGDGLGDKTAKTSEVKRYTVPDYRSGFNHWLTSRDFANHACDTYQRASKYYLPYSTHDGQPIYETAAGSTYMSPMKYSSDKIYFSSSNGAVNGLRMDYTHQPHESQPDVRPNIRDDLSPKQSLSVYASNGLPLVTSPQSPNRKSHNGFSGCSGSSTYAAALDPNLNDVHQQLDEKNDLDGPRPLTPHQALKLYWRRLSQVERTEILSYPKIYFLGLDAAKIGMNDKPSTNDNADCLKKRSSDNQGFDDDRSGYKLVLNDHIAYRYELIKLLGKGSFGQVVQARDHRTGSDVALKIIRSEERFARQAQEEISILQALNEEDTDGHYNVVKLLDHFVFRRHVCMVFELLNLNLYEILQRNDFRGLSQGTVSKLTRGILECMNLLHKNNIIHCDLKPENVLLRSAARCAIKVIDFGSSCYTNQRVYTYIQSRFYRAPEIILGMEYGPPIDMWSLGCIVAEMITGTPIFPGEDEADQLARIMELIGVPPRSMLAASGRANKFFTPSGEPLYALDQISGAGYFSDNRNGNIHASHPTSAGKSPREMRGLPNSIDLLTALTMHKRSSVCLPGEENLFRQQSRSLVGRVEPVDADLLDFLSRCFQWIPSHRMNPIEALNHPWITKRRTMSSVDKKLTHSPQFNSNGNGGPNVPNGLKKLTSIDIPDSVKAAFGDTEELLRKMQNVRIRKGSLPSEDEITPTRRYSQLSRGERSSSKGIRRFSSCQETIRHLMEPLDNLEVPRKLSSRYYNRPSNSRNYREFLSNGGDIYPDVHSSPIKRTEDEVDSYRRHRPRRPSNRQRDSLLLRVDDSRSRRIGGLFDGSA